MTHKIDPSKDYYATLGISSEANAADIQRAYRERAKEYHPDQNQDRAEWAEEKFKEISEAYAILGDTQDRAAYDRLRWQERIRQQREAASRASTATSPPPQASKTPNPQLNRYLLWLWVVPLGLILGILAIGIIVAVVLNDNSEDGPTDEVEFAVAPALELNAIERERLEIDLTANTDWEITLRDVGGVEMALVPAGCFVMGEAPANSTERAQQTVCFEEHFWIDRYEVSNAQYGGWIVEMTDISREDFVCQSEWCDDARPRDSISWEDAAQFCAMRGGRLPSSAEWEYAARGVESWLYPWGDEFNAEWVVFRDTFGGVATGDTRPATFAVDALPEGASWVGAEQMLGNVQEWVSDLRQIGSEDRDRILRGGAANNNEIDLTTTDIFGQLVELEDYNGFRCVRD